MMRADRQAAWDALLLWASEVGSAEWREWKDACVELDLEPSEAAGVLAQLGHAEFDWSANTFATAAGVLVQVAGAEGLFFLAGSRVFGTVERLREQAAQSNLDVEVAEPVGQGGRGPSSILVECAIEDVEAFAQSAGLLVEWEVERLAALLPTISLELVAELRAPDLRYPHCRVDHDSLRPLWGTPSLEGEPGLWLVRGVRRKEAYLREAETWWHIPIREYGPYLVSVGLADPPLIEYEEANHLLHVRSRAALPPLHARAATLCSGRLPLRRPRADEHLDTYVNVGPRCAHALMSSLGCDAGDAPRPDAASAAVDDEPVSADRDMRRDDARFRPGLLAARKLLAHPTGFGAADLDDFSVFKGMVGVSFKHDRPWKRAWQLLGRPGFKDLRRAYQPISAVRPSMLAGERDRVVGLSHELDSLGVPGWVSHALELVDGRGGGGQA